MSESIGMMDKAYFVGKQEILNWFNTHLSVSLPASLTPVCDSIYTHASTAATGQD